MRFSNGKRLTVMSLLFLGYALYTAFTGGDIELACTALILSGLENSDEV